MFNKKSTKKLEIQSNNELSEAKNKFEINYNIALNSLSEKRLLNSSVHLDILIDLSEATYEDYSNKSIKSMQKIFDGKHNKIFTRYGKNKLKQLLQDKRIELQHFLEVNLEKLESSYSYSKKPDLRSKFEIIDHELSLDEYNLRNIQKVSIKPLVLFFKKICAILGKFFKILLSPI